MLTTVVLDVGETLVDETPSWAAWADWLRVPPFTLFAVLGGLVARGEDHRDVVPVLLPGRTFEQERTARLAAGHPWPSPALYPDALPCLHALRADGWRVVVGGNQPVAFQRLVESLDLPVDLITSSGELGAEKPSREFYRRIASAAGTVPEQCVSVGDRVDNDVVGALAAGMTAVHLRRGPWGVLHGNDPRLSQPGVHRLDGLGPLPALLRSLRQPTGGLPPRTSAPYGTMGGMSFSVVRDVRASETVLSVTGDLDIATVTALRVEVEDVVSATPERLYLDLTPTEFIDSTGCRELVRAAKHGRSAGVPVELVAPPDNWRVRRVVDFMQFGEVLPVHDEAPWG